MKTSILKLFSIAISMALLSMSVGIQPAYAAGIVVNTNADTFDVGGNFNCTNVTIANLPGLGDGKISLREAICAANNTAGTDTITFDASINGSAITLTSDLSQITGNLTITGNGAANTLIDGASSYQVFNIAGGVTVNLSDLTLQNGRAINGGGINNSGTLTVSNSTFSGNKDTGGYGGGIVNVGTLTVSNSTFSGNSANNAGGGIAANFGTTTITNSTFSGNKAGSGGGIYENVGATLTVTGSTVSGNSAQYSGGGIYISGTATITNSTLSGNSATFRRSGAGGGIEVNSGTATVTNSTLSGNSATGSGGGIFSTNSTITLNNTIVANSTSGGDCTRDKFSPSTLNASHSLIMDGLTCVNGTNTANLTGDPLLGSLADNGGPTQTMALLSGSPAIDTADDTICAAAVGSPNYGAGGVDQRGVARPQPTGGTCDIGAYELDNTYPSVVTSNPADGAKVYPGPTQITVTFSENMLHDGSTKAADYLGNYHLIQRGPNNVYDSLHCNDQQFPTPDDTTVTIDSVGYNATTFTSTLSVNSGIPLPIGEYRLFVCGTASVHDMAGNALNGGDVDYIATFTVAITETPTKAVSLPKTGFTPNVITSLPQQPADLAYADLGSLWLEIPSLNVSTNIVGVPEADNAWDVKWLGNDVGWLNGTAFPTWVGNSVITGHVTDSNGKPGPFAQIKSLSYGDQVIVHLYGEKYIFQVRKTRLVRPDTTAFAFEHLEDHAYLTLITCQGYNPFNGSYLFRRIVRAVLVDVQNE